MRKTHIDVIGVHISVTLVIPAIGFEANFAV